MPCSFSPGRLEENVTPRTKAILAVDYTGHPCDYNSLRSIVDRQGCYVVVDACHALGASYEGRRVGTLADVTVLSLHPVKHITSGEGGIVTTDTPELAERMRKFRNHCISVESLERLEGNSWLYEISELGYNYRLTDFHCSLARSQLRKLPEFLARRRAIAERYRTSLQDTGMARPLGIHETVEHAYHLFVTRPDLDGLKVGRGQVFSALMAEGVGVNVHYIPARYHLLCRHRIGVAPGLWPIAESDYEQIVSLPVFAAMTEADIDDLVTALRKVLAAYGN